MNVQLLPIHSLFSQDATRLSRDEEHINALAADFQQALLDHPDAHPVKNPLRVIQRGDRFLIIAGNYRYLAGLRVPLEDMPCIVLPGNLDEAGLLIEQAKDNELHRAYTPIERARNVHRVMELRGCSQAEAGRLLGITNPADVSKLLSVLKNYPEDLHPLIGEEDGKVPFTTAYALSRLHPDEQKIRDLTDKVVRGLLKRDRAEEQVGKLTGKKQKREKPTKIRLPNGTIMVIPGGISDEAVAMDHAAFGDANKRREKYGLPMSSLLSLLKSA